MHLTSDCTKGKFLIFFLFLFPRSFFFFFKQLFSYQCHVTFLMAESIITDGGVIVSHGQSF